MLYTDFGEYMTTSKKQLTQTEAYTWNYLNEHFQEIITLNISEVGEIISVSTATITRTLQKKGYRGFVDFKHSMENNAQDELNILAEPLLNDETKISILKSYQEVTRTLNMLDLKTLNEVVDLLLETEKVIIFARGFSELLGTKMQTKLLLLGIYTELYTDPNIIRTISKRLDTRTCVIFISLNGETHSLQNAASNCQARLIPNVLISSNQAGNLGKLTDYQLYGFKTELTYFPDFEVHSRLPLYIIMRLLLDTLAVNMKA